MLDDVYEALADSLRSGLDFDDMDVIIAPDIVLNPGEPCIDMLLGAPTTDPETVGMGEYDGMDSIIVRFRLVPNDFRESMKIIRALNDRAHPLYMPAAIEADQDLNGWATGVFYERGSASGMLDFSFQTTEFVGCTWRVLIARAES